MNIGYKFMVLDKESGLFHSLADRRNTVTPAFNHLVYRDQFWLGSTIAYVQTYYGSSDFEHPEEMPMGEDEVLLAFKYDLSDIIPGTNSSQGKYDPGIEFAVRNCWLQEAYNVTKKSPIILKGGHYDKHNYLRMEHLRKDIPDKNIVRSWY